ncbi:hypothetical protein RB653_005158 [Dictyostelium firmibasis]|uniref:VTT domain-containing protein n=1 Tax=Dictyostelium firmibasis TaxID=79012 RepID=A0AAN7YXX6_9MYCE
MVRPTSTAEDIENTDNSESINQSQASSISSSVSSTTAWTFSVTNQQQKPQEQSNNITPMIASTRKIEDLEKIDKDRDNKEEEEEEEEDDEDKESIEISEKNTEVEKIPLPKKIINALKYIGRRIIRFKPLTWVKIFILACMITLICVVVFKFKLQSHFVEYLKKLQNFVDNDHNGRLIGGFIYMGAFMLLIIFLIPVTIPTVLGGAIFGFWYTLLFVWCASMVGGCISFLIGRFLLRGSISKMVAKSKRMTAVDQAVAQESFKLVLLLRFTPIVPESILNYALSVAKISVARYLICTAIGLLPGTSFFIYIGAVIVGSITKFDKDGLDLGKGTIVLYAVSGALMVINMVVITVIVKKAVQKKLKEQEDANDAKEKRKEERKKQRKSNINGDSENDDDHYSDDEESIGDSDTAPLLGNDDNNNNDQSFLSKLKRFISKI